MHFKIDKTKFVGPLTLAAGAAAGVKKDSLDIRTHVLIEVPEKGLGYITGANNETTVRTAFEPTTIAAGSYCIPAAKLLEIVQARSGEIEIKKDDKGSVIIKEGKYKVNIQVNTADKFPSAPKLDDATASSIDPGIFLSLLKRAAYVTAGEEDKRFALKSVLLHFKDNVLRVVTTNGQMIAFGATPAVTEKEMKLIVPLKGLADLKSFMQAAEEKVDMSLSAKRMMLKAGSNTLHIQLLEGTYPEYERIIPKAPSFSVECNRESFLQAIKSVCVISNGKTRSIVFTPDAAGKLLLKTETKDVGNAEDEVAAKADGSLVDFLLSPELILKAATAFTGEILKIRGNGAMEPVFVQAESDVFAVIAPMRP